MDREDRIATLAALVLVAGIVGFAIAQSDDGVVGAYYYFSDSPDPRVNELTRKFAIQYKIPQNESARRPVDPPLRVDRTQPAANSG